MGDWSGFIQGLIADSSKGYIYQKYGYVNDSGTAYFKGQDGNTYPQGAGGVNPSVNSPVTGNNMMIIVAAVALVAVVVVMD
jgi:hypothetical protein